MKQYIFGLNPVKPNKRIFKFLESTQKELKSFFGVTIENPFVFFIESRRDMDRIIGRKTKQWESGWAENNSIFILNPKIYTKESSHKDIEHFWQVLKHEYCHLYFTKITGGSLPKWLNEGLACYMADQVKKVPTKKKLLKVFDYYSKSDSRIYSIGYSWTKLLIDRFGKRKLLKLIKSVDCDTSERKFAKKFYQVYGFNYSKKDFDKVFDDYK